MYSASWRLGYTYKEIGVRLSISARTVETHAAAVLRKLQLSNRKELTRWASARRYGPQLMAGLAQPSEHPSATIGRTGSRR